jgi:hypothetical protein
MEWSDRIPRNTFPPGRHSRKQLKSNQRGHIAENTVLSQQMEGWPYYTTTLSDGKSNAQKGNT